MLSRKNKDLRTIKEGVVGKYVKKETPPEMPSEYQNVSSFVTLCECLYEIVFPSSVYCHDLLFSNQRLDYRTNQTNQKTQPVVDTTIHGKGLFALSTQWQ